MIYGILSTIAFVIILPFWLILGLFLPKLTNGFKEKCGVYRNLGFQACHCEEGHSPDAAIQDNNLECFADAGKDKKNILFYGISVGEVLAMENLIKKTRETFPENKIIVLTGTKTGQDMAHKKLGETADFISYFPFDFPFSINNMLNKLKPNAIFIMETELWPNFANITNNKKIPTYIINARISDRTFKSYKKLKFFFAPILKKYTNIFPQSEQDKEKFLALGAKPQTTKVMGNLKFDIKKPDVSSLNFEKAPKDKILLAGSTHSGEDEIIIEAFCELKKEIPELKLIIAPRHPERNENVFKLMKKIGFDCAKRSEMSPHPNPLPAVERENVIPSCLLLDTMGELGKFYSVCDIAFIGGSFNKRGKGIGGHNPLEATVFQKPVISGPSIHNFKDIYAILVNEKAAKIVCSKNELIDEAKKLFQDENYYSAATKACEQVFEQNNGALDFVIEVLQKLA